MAKRISKHVREEAALALSALSSARAAGHQLYILDTLDRGSPAAELACATFQHVMDHDAYMPWHLHYAEAEALLRTGWSPP